MKRLAVVAVFFSAFGFTACSSGGASGGSSSPPGDSGGFVSCSPACLQSAADNQLASMSVTDAPISDPAPASAGPSTIVDQYDTATCADWGVTDSQNRSIAVAYYATEYNDPQPASDAGSLIGIITKSCNAYGTAETPSHIAKVTIATVYGGN